MGWKISASLFHVADETGFNHGVSLFTQFDSSFYQAYNINA